ncbi:hypothetical protein [Shewanella waksmanii]|uniref:hypothetical protein n=1 Tax=Shewanella waksmanii TaxID=213783 RepID=UPI0037357A35
MSRYIATFLVLVSTLLLSACKLTLVQPYDEKLLSGTEAFYKSTALAIEQAREKSPKTRKLEPGQSAEQNSGYIGHYQSTYAKMRVDANALILRAMVNSGEVDSWAKTTQAKIDELITSAIPSNCASGKSNINDITLTVSNYLDLKCLVSYWQQQHEEAPNKILTSVNWESRQKSLMDMIIALQKTESFKKSTTAD